MSNKTLVPLEIRTLNSFNFNNRRKKVKIWSKRLELIFGFIPAFLVWVISYGKRFR